MIVRFGSARTTASSTSSSTTTITRSAANAASFWQPSRPQTWVLPFAVGALGMDDRDVGLERRHGVDLPVAVWRRHLADQRVGHRQVGLEVRPQREERQVRGPRGVPRDHPEMRVLLELERGHAQLRDRGRLDAPPDRVEPAHARVAEPREDQLPRDAARDHLVVDDVGRHAAQGQVAPALADDLVAGRERDEVREPLDGDAVAIPDELRDRVAHGRDLARHASPAAADGARGCGGDPPSASRIYPSSMVARTAGASGAAGSWITRYSHSPMTTRWTTRSRPSQRKA